MCGLAAIVAQRVVTRTLHAKVLWTMCEFCCRLVILSLVSLLWWPAHNLRVALLNCCVAPSQGEAMGRCFGCVVDLVWRADGFVVLRASVRVVLRA